MRLNLILPLALVTACGAPAPSLSRARSTRVAWPAVPDPHLTPGSLCTAADPHFRAFAYPARVPLCKRALSRAMKLQIGAAYGVAESDWSKYEFDHYLPLAIGGSTSVDNIWPQPKAAAAEKDRLEVDLWRQLKAGEITQAEAVTAIRAWRPHGGGPAPAAPQPE